mgnify:CR=1 FL=1
MPRLARQGLSPSARPLKKNFGGGNPLSWLLSFALQLNWNIAEWLLKDKLVAYRQSDALALEHAASTTENAARSAWAASVALTRASCAQYAYKYENTARLQAELVLVQQAYDAHGVSRTALRSKEIAVEQAALAELLQEQAVLEQLPAALGNLPKPGHCSPGAPPRHSVLEARPLRIASAAGS